MLSGLHVPHGTSLWSSVRAWNNGFGSTRFVSTPVTIDLTPPQATVACAGGLSQPGSAWQFRVRRDAPVAEATARAFGPPPPVRSCEGVAYQTFTTGFWVNWAPFYEDISPIGTVGEASMYGMRLRERVRRS